MLKYPPPTAVEIKLKFLATPSSNTSALPTATTAPMIGPFPILMGMHINPTSGMSTLVLIPLKLPMPVPPPTSPSIPTTTDPCLSPALLILPWLFLLRVVRAWILDVFMARLWYLMAALRSIWNTGRPQLSSSTSSTTSS